MLSESRTTRRNGKYLSLCVLVLGACSKNAVPGGPSSETNVVNAAEEIRPHASATGAEVMWSHVGDELRVAVDVDMHGPLQSYITGLSTQLVARLGPAQQLTTCGLHLEALSGIRAAVGAPLRIATEIDGRITSKQIACVLGQQTFDSLLSMGLVVQDRPQGVEVTFNPLLGKNQAEPFLSKCRPNGSCAVAKLGPLDNASWAITSQSLQTVRLHLVGAGIVNAAKDFAAAVKLTAEDVPELKKLNMDGSDGLSSEYSIQLADGTATLMATAMSSLLESFRLPTVSMIPSLQKGDNVFALKGRLLGAPAVGSIYVHRRGSATFLKRIIATEGQVVGKRQRQPLLRDCAGRFYFWSRGRNLVRQRNRWSA
jgi:hypothetical protein